MRSSAKQREWADNNRTRNREWFFEYKSRLSCEVCGFSHPAALQFHHLQSSTKRNSVSQLVQQGYPISTILEEIAKCAVLCGNCHSELTCSSNKSSNVSRRDWFTEYKDTLQCSECGVTGGYRLHFHHVDPDTKYLGVAVMVTRHYPKSQIFDEIEKCLCLCNNCHFITEYGHIYG